jgi:DNA-binding LytR/AlgR family response regulator
MCLQIKDAIKEYCRGQVEAVRINIFHSGEEVFEFFTDGNDLDLLFLDIELKELNGVDLGVKIRVEFKNEDIQIIYISAKQNYAMDLFQVRPLNFLVKPIDLSIIGTMIEKAIELNGKNDYFSFKVGRNFHKKRIKDILYFESQGRQIKMVTVDKDIKFYDKLKNVLEVLIDYDFFSIHKSVITNYNHIINFSYDQVVMSNNEVLAISQSHRKEVRSLQLQYEKEVVERC